MDFTGEARKLSESDYKRAAEKLDCDVAAVKAVAAVESRGGGFLAGRRPKILFEAHQFGRRTDFAFNRSHPNISSRKWNRDPYGPGGAHQYQRLKAAIALAENAALSSASWGMFQVMGFNFESCGYPSVRAFVDAMIRSEGDHLDAMLGYVQHRRLDEALRNHDWATFAHGYNGP